MIAVDTNILAYAHKTGSPMHADARRAVEQLRSRREPWAIAWPCIYEFINIVTHPKIYSPASTIGEAMNAIDNWLAADNLHLLHETADFLPALKNLVSGTAIRGPKIHDARIAALCLHHGCANCGRRTAISRLSRS